MRQKMRKKYKFSHSAYQGGYLYAHKVANGKIKNKEGLRNALNAAVKKFELIDSTIKIYDSVFFLFFMPKPSLKPTVLIESIQ